MTGALDGYQHRLMGLKDDPQILLPVLLARDEVEGAVEKTRPLPLEGAQRLVKLDGDLIRDGTGAASEELSAWRQSLHPPEAHWWWFLDKRVAEREKESDLPWVLWAGTLLTLTAALALEILKRLLVGAPDTLSVVGTLVTLLLTASPLSKSGRELAQWILGRLPIARLRPRYHAEAMAVMATLAFVLVALGWLLSPQLAKYYNNAGRDALRAGNLTAAKQAFQRTVALDPDLVVPYQNLADVYQQIGRPQEAQAYYQKAIERDLNFGPAYQGLGHFYNLQGEFAQAEQVLLAGLSRAYEAKDAALATVMRYQLLSDLGWAYFGQEQPERALAALKAAIELEGELKAQEERTGTQYRIALPHYTLAQVYEQLDRPQEAIQQWEESLRLLNPQDWADQDQITTALSRIRKLEEKGP